MSDYVTVFMDNDTELRLAQIVKETGRDPYDLMSAAIAEAALDYFRHRSDDPAK